MNVFVGICMPFESVMGEMTMRLNPTGYDDVSGCILTSRELEGVSYGL